MSAHNRELVMGVDFGTSYSSAGVLIDGRAELVLDNGESMIPSVVYLPERGAPLVGRPALMRVLDDPGATVQSIKRVLGHDVDDPAVRRHDASVGYGLIAGPDNRVLLRVRRAEFACEQIVAYILARLRDLAEQRFGARVTKAVITASAAAGTSYAEAIRRAARIANLEVVQILAEPVAGALSMGMHGEPQNRRLAILDFGGGTFDATIVDQIGRQFRPIAFAGDAYLGGDDFDEVLVNAVAGAVYKRSSFDMLRDAVRRQQLAFRCEEVKRRLSTESEVPLVMQDAYIAKGERRDLNLLIERSWIEPKWQPLVDRTNAVVTRLLAAAKTGPETIDQILLIGGTSMVPLFDREIRARFPDTPVMRSDHANLAVALGATLQTTAHGEGHPAVPVLLADDPLN